MLSALQPSVSKACSRCRARKVKCDLKVPRCSACTRQNDDCNITDCVSYPYSVVRSLLDQIAELQAQLTTSPNVDGAPPVIPQPIPEVQVQVQNGPSRASDVSGGNGYQGWQNALQKEAEEVGVLSIGGTNPYSESKYVGSAAGSTFARIFFNQINLTPSSEFSHEEARFLSERNAALPPQPIARCLLNVYIRRVHIWWPLLPLPHLRRTIQRIYQNPRQCSDQEKFSVFMVLALASSHIDKSDDNTAASMDINEPAAYFSTSLRFFNGFFDHPRDLFGIQAVLLLAIWMLNSASSSHTNDLWHLSRYVMSAAIEAGMHRHNTNWGFGAEELEIRNRTWWCAYNLERQVATVTGRVLSVRDHAIHALLPKSSSFDSLSQPESLAAPIYHQLSVAIFNHIVALRRIGGRILESIYIARGSDGKAMDTSFQQICADSDKVRLSLEQWKQKLHELDIKPSREYSEMKIEYAILELLLHRPSPTFMVPSREMASRCSKAASSAVRQWSKLDKEYGISVVCRCFRQLHDILLVGLVGLYCDWQISILPQYRSSNGPRPYRHFGDTGICLDLMERGISEMKASHLTRHRDILMGARNRVYADAILSEASPNEIASYRSTVSSHILDPAGGPGSGGVIYMGDGLEAYLNQVNEFLDDENYGMDEAINAWYHALMEDFNGNDSRMAVESSY